MAALRNSRKSLQSETPPLFPKEDLSEAEARGRQCAHTGDKLPVKLADDVSREQRIAAESGHPVPGRRGAWSGIGVVPLIKKHESRQ